MKTNALAAMIISVCMLTGCNGSGDTASVNDAIKPVVPEEQDKSIAEMTAKEFNLTFGNFQPDTLPDFPDMEVNDSTPEGVDENGNNVRDDVEVVAYQAVSFIEGTDKTDYEELLDVFRMLNPDSEVVQEKDIYCAYQALPEKIKEDMSLGLIYRFALNTKERKLAYAEKVTSFSGSLGDEVCPK